MSIHWSDSSSAIAAIFSAVTGGLALAATVRANRTAEAANRTAEAVAQIERDRWHVDLTPEFDVHAAELGPGTEQASLHIRLTKPTGLPRLDRVVVHIRDDGYDHRPIGDETQEEIDRTIFGPYRFKEGVRGVSEEGRTVEGRPLGLDEWDKFWLRRSSAPSWAAPDVWRQEYAGEPLRLLIECHADGHRAWYVPYAVAVQDPSRPEAERGSGGIA